MGPFGGTCLPSVGSGERSRGDAWSGIGRASDGKTGSGEVGEVVLPNAFLLETAEEALDQTVLLGCVRGDELLLEPVVSA